MTKVAFIGAGNMNAAIIKGLINNGFQADHIIVSNPSPEKRETLAAELGIKQTAENNEAVTFADIIILGVKPYLIAEVCEAFTQHCSLDGKCFLSVAAGTTVAQIQQALGGHKSVIRTMPNTPSQIGLGMTGMFAAPGTSAEQKAISTELMSAAGEVVWLESEEQINQITSLSGSGPAYFFLFMEAMEKQARAYGFDEATSRKIVQQTALGAATMVKANNDLSIGELRANVTSKGGTTHAALTNFIEKGIEPLVISSVKAAFNRAEEMAKG